MNLTSFLLPILLLSASLPSAAAESKNGVELLKKCASVLRHIDREEKLSPLSMMDSAFCVGLIQGVSNTNAFYAADPKFKPYMCMPEKGVNNEQGARIVVKFLTERPEKLHMNDTLLVIVALRDAFPCEQ